MKNLKVCFVGIGSIARRHITNLQEVCLKRGIDLLIDAYRREPVSVEGIANVYSDISEVPNDYDAVFITNPTELHLDSLNQFHNKADHFFIEKPVVSLHQIEDARRFIPRSNSVYYVACPLRYNAVIQYIKQNITPDDVISVRSISSSYLPDWRTGQDYRKSYSAHRDFGGGVSIDLIHEWDYLTYLFGWPERIHSFIGKKSHLEIDSDDYAVYIAEYNDKIVELHLDYFGRKTIREVQLFTTDDTIVGDIASNRISFLKSGRVIDFNEKRDDYQMRELSHFIDMVMDGDRCKSGYENGLRVLNLSQGII